MPKKERNITFIQWLIVSVFSQSVRRCLPFSHFLSFSFLKNIISNGIRWIEIYRSNNNNKEIEKKWCFDGIQAKMCRNSMPNFNELWVKIDFFFSLSLHKTKMKLENYSEKFSGKGESWNFFLFSNFINFWTKFSTKLLPEHEMARWKIYSADSIRQNKTHTHQKLMLIM